MHMRCRMADDCGTDDVPPLEDMSELLEQAKQMQSLNERSSSSTPLSLSSSNKTTSLRPSNDVAVGSVSSSKNNNYETAQVTKSSSASGGFGGMKKGFLFGGPSKKSTSSSGKSAATSLKSTQKADPNPVGESDIPLIQRTEGSGDRKEQYRIDEVQEALKATAPLLRNKDWVNDDLLSNLEKHPRLAKQLADPRLAQAIHKFQSNPQQAMEEYSDDAEVQQFFKDFCSLLGNHFSSMGGSSLPPMSSSAPPSQDIRTQATSIPDIKVRSSTNPKQATAADEAKMQQILSNPGIREILMDQRIQQLMEVLKTNPDQGQRILQSAGPEMQGKIHKLVQAGLLGFS